MKTFFKIAAIICGLLFILLTILLHREHFGNEAGNVLLIAEIFIPIYSYVGFRLWKKGRKDEAISGTFFLIAFLFAFLGWFVHPETIYRRALGRLIEWETVIKEYQGTASSELTDKPKVIERRLREELAARKLEYQAARIRYTGELKFFRSTFYTWSLWILAAVFIVIGIITASTREKQIIKKPMKGNQNA